MTGLIPSDHAAQPCAAANGGIALLFESPRLVAAVAELGSLGLLLSMRVAALYDIHGNLPALEAVLGNVARSRADRVVVGARSQHPDPVYRW